MKETNKLLKEQEAKEALKIKSTESNETQCSNETLEANDTVQASSNQHYTSSRNGNQTSNKTICNKSNSTAPKINWVNETIRVDAPPAPPSPEGPWFGQNAQGEWNFTLEQQQAIREYEEIESVR